MKLLMAVILLMTSVGVYLTTSPLHVTGGHEGPKQNRDFDVDRNQAIKIVQQHATNTNIDTTRYDATACETELSWRVYLEPIADQDSRKVLEYVVTRKGGAVVANTVLTGWKNSARGKNDSVIRTIAQADALATVKKDLRHLDISSKRLTVCELKNFWRIIYSPAAPLDGGGPEYLIDKTTGRIVDKKFYQ